MKNSIREFWRTNGFYVSFGLGIVALVAALAIYNVNSRKGTQNQNINLNEPAGSDLAHMDSTKDIDLNQNSDLDVPIDMQQGEPNESVATGSDHVISDGVSSDQTQGSTLFDEQEMGEQIASRNTEGDSAGMNPSDEEDAVADSEESELQETMSALHTRKNSLKPGSLPAKSLGALRPIST